MQERAQSPARQVRLGHLLFLLYLAFYGAFVLVNAFAPQLMEKTPLGGVNLAVLSGLGLIVLAFLLALVYEWICGSAEGRGVSLRSPGTEGMAKGGSGR
jgi:uncharacterized membrane protein (DUF485 family)